MKINSIVLKPYIFNASDILYLSTCDIFSYYYNKLDNNKTIINNKNIHRKSEITSIEQLIYNLDSFINYLKSTFYIDPLEMRYIIELLLNEKNNIFLNKRYYNDHYEFYIKSFKELIHNVYIRNNKKMASIMPSISKYTDFDSLRSIINHSNKNVYVLFEMPNDNVYYVTMWNKLFKDFI